MIKSITIFQMRNNQVINQHFATIFIEILSDLANITNVEKTCCNNQRWSPRGRPWPRGHILKFLASRPQVLENWSVLGSSTALFFDC